LLPLGLPDIVAVEVWPKVPDTEIGPADDEKVDPVPSTL